MPATKKIDVQEAQQRLAELVKLAAGGAEIVLTEREQPMARLVAAAEATRKAGLHRGAMSMSNDFDAPLPEGFWAGAA